MPSATYMVVDPRHDHSFRVPRPDLSVELGIPNACTSCHLDRSARWAAAQVNSWFGHVPQGYQRFAKTFAAADTDRTEAQALLRALASDETQAPIARATALAGLGGSLSRQALATIAAGLRNESAVVRLGALESSELLPPAQRLQLVAPLLSDSLRVLRVAAARLLAAVPSSQWTPDQRAAFQRASGEFIETQRQNADRAEARVNLGTFLAELGDLAGGQVELQSAIRLEPGFVPAYVNLADVYRSAGRDADGEHLLRDGLARTPASPMLHYTLGLVLTRLNRGDTALREFARAASLDPGNARFSYVHAVALHSAGKVGTAIATLEATLATHPRDGDVLSALAAFHSERGDSAQARRYRDRLSVLAGNR
jgi:predicted Zn-dependent protease